MRAFAFDGQRAGLVDRPDPVAREGQAIVRPIFAGVCNTDLELVRGYMGFEGVLGHEVVGVVDGGPDTWRGARVTCEINYACGNCPRCDEGLGRHCPNRTVMGILGQDGAMAERLAVPVANLHRVPDAIDDRSAAFVEPLAAAFEILEQLGRVEGKRATVLGDGKLGLLVAQVLAAAGAQVTAVGHHDDHLAILRERGIHTVQERDWTRDRMPLVVEATGTSAGLALALAATEPRGTVVLKSTVADREAIDLAPVVIDEITVLGSRCGPFAPALEALAASRVDVASLIDAEMPLDDAARAFERAGTRGALKVLLRCTEA